MVGRLILGQEHSEQVLDLPQADAHGERGGGELSLLVLVENDPASGLALQYGDRLAEPLILGAEFGHDLGVGFVGEPLLDLASVLVHRLTTAGGLFGLSSDGAVLTGIGSLSECRIHWPARPEFPPQDEFATFRGALEIAAIQGIIADGEPHLHLIVVEGGDRRAVGGHMEKGCKVLYLAEITIVKFRGPPMTRRPNEHGVKMLGPR